MKATRKALWLLGRAIAVDYYFKDHTNGRPQKRKVVLSCDGGRKQMKEVRIKNPAPSNHSIL
jgi:hypothetical protein